jgi:hypothetical protein
MDDFSGHEHPITELLDDALGSKLNKAVHSIASSFGIEGAWLTGTSVANDEDGATHGSIGAVPPEVDVNAHEAVDFAGSDQEPKGPGVGTGEHDDHLSRILHDADYLSLPSGDP